MGLFDFLKKKEFAEIERLSTELTTKDHEIDLLQTRINSLKKYEGILDADNQAKSILAEAQQQADHLVKQARITAEAFRKEAERIVASAHQNAENIVHDATSQSTQLVSVARQKASEIRDRADAVLAAAQTQASRILKEAQDKAHEIAGNAYKLQDQKDELEKTVTALKNTLKGYGDDYIVPTYSLLDELAEDFSYTEAGEKLKTARMQSRLMVKNQVAATCDYVEPYRRTTAINFVTDAFNGKVDSILSTVKHDNFGTLKQKIIDAFNLVNNLGKAFRDAKITPVYLDARLDELKWATIVIELKLKEREEQRRIKEQMREEERARREFERAIKESQKEEDILKKAMEKAYRELEGANEAQKEKYEQKLAELQERLRLAEEKGQRALSMAQQTKSGHVYVISNIGSFGENIYKIGMTRRLEPTDRVRELGDASVPFSFDIHAMIYSENAPGLECELHRFFVDNQLNKVNPRKEFFKVGIQAVREKIESMGLQTQWTMVAEAAQYKESIAIEKAMQENQSARDEWKQKIAREISEDILGTDEEDVA